MLQEKIFSGKTKAETNTPKITVFYFKYFNLFMFAEKKNFPFIQKITLDDHKNRNLENTGEN